MLTTSTTSTVLVQAVIDPPVITSTNLIKIDLSSAGDADGGDLSDWNSLSHGGNSSSVKRYGDGQVIDGVTISVNGSGSNNAGASAFWPGTDMDPYYVKATDDLVYSTNSGEGVTGRSNELNITTTGLETDRLYTVRI